MSTLIAGYVGHFMMFNKDELTVAMPNDGRFELTIAGKFKSGQYFVGSNFITIKK